MLSWLSESKYLRIAMKACQNPGCVVRGRVIYTLATRCPLCKWDLTNGSDTARDGSAQQTIRKPPVMRPSAHSAGSRLLLKTRRATG